LPPPTHLRGDAEAQKQFLADYEQVLSGWSQEVLEAAWPDVLSRQEFWIWPRPQQIHDACKQIASQRQQPINHEERRREAEELANRYTHKYLRRSQLAKLAEKEGWITSLTHFVQESAWVQAQLLCKVSSIGWDTSIAAHLGEFHSSQEAFNAFRQTVAGAIRRGRIEVHVPPALIRAWKDEVQNSLDKPRHSAL
jgi:hypothetical protein